MICAARHLHFADRVPSVENFKNDMILTTVSSYSNIDTALLDTGYALLLLVRSHLPYQHCAAFGFNILCHAIEDLLQCGLCERVLRDAVNLAMLLQLLEHLRKANRSAEWQAETPIWAEVL